VRWDVLSFKNRILVSIGLSLNTTLSLNNKIPNLNQISLFEFMMTDFTINVESIGMDERLSDEKLEQAFREAEEASERRLEEEEEEEESPPAPLGSIAGNLNALGVAKKRRRGSISISRVGTHPELAALQSEVPTPGNASPVPWAPSTPYHIRSGSASSLTSEEESEVDHAAEENHVTQKQTIVGRRNTISKAVGSVFSRTLPRMRSLHALSDIAQNEVVIGIKVQESTTEEEKKSEDAPVPASDSEANAISTSTSQAIAPSRNSFVITADATASSSSRSKRNSAKVPLRTQTSSRSLPESTADSKKLRDEKERSRSLMYYARMLAQKFRRKSISSKRAGAAKAPSSDNLKKVQATQMATLPEERVKSDEGSGSLLSPSAVQPKTPTSATPVSKSPPTAASKRSSDASSPTSVPLPPSPIASAHPTSIL